MKKIGYVIGLFIEITLFIIIVNFLFCRGNDPTESEITSVIDESKIDIINLNKAA